MSGMDASSHLLTMNVIAPATKYRNFDDLMTFIHRLDDQLNTVQGADAAATTASLFGNPRQLGIEGRTLPNGERLPTVLMFNVGPRYFDALGVRLARGRALRDTDGNPGNEVAVINQRLADLYFRARIRLDRGLAQR